MSKLLKAKSVVAVLLSLILCFGMCFSLSACGSSDDASSEEASPATEVKTVCSNGTLVGSETEGVISYLGVPFAKPPVDDLRWKAPVPAEDSDEEIQCTEFGDTALQYEWKSEPASFNEKSEDCLTLNIWMSKAAAESDEPKDVMVFFHGGAYGWGGTSDEMYNGKDLAAAHDDMIFVTCNYRLNAMGFADFTKVPGGEEYTDLNLALRDHICALEWINKNISNFGGSPEDVTIFGESAGGWSTSSLLLSPMSTGLFKNAIMESGVVIPKDREVAQEFAATLMKDSGAKNMEELLAITGDEWMEIDDEMWYSDEYYGMVYDGETFPYEEDWDKELKAKIDAGVNIMLGTNKDEWNYFVQDQEGDTFEEMFEAWDSAMDDTIDGFKETLDEDGLKTMDELYAIFEKRVPKEYAKDKKTKEALVKSAFLTSTWRQDHIMFAERYANQGGNVYFYNWDVPSSLDDYYKSSVHAIELPYVFNNDDGIYSGEINKDVQAQTQKAWTNFAKTGDPSFDDVTWTKWSTDGFDTMMITADGWSMESDPDGNIREMLDLISGYAVLW